MRRPTGLPGVFLIVQAQLVAGLVAGWLWKIWAPRTDVIKAGSGVYLANYETKSLIGADLRLAIITAGFGIGFGVLTAWWVRSSAGFAGVVLLAEGALGAGLLAAWVGARLGRGNATSFFLNAPDGAHGSIQVHANQFGALAPGLGLGATIGLVLWPLAAVGVSGLLISWQRYFAPAPARIEPSIPPIAEEKP